MAGNNTPEVVIHQPQESAGVEQSISSRHHQPLSTCTSEGPVVPGGIATTSQSLEIEGEAANVSVGVVAETAIQLVLSRYSIILDRCYILWLRRGAKVEDDVCVTVTCCYY